MEQAGHDESLWFNTSKQQHVTAYLNKKLRDPMKITALCTVAQVLEFGYRLVHATTDTEVIFSSVCMVFSVVALIILTSAFLGNL